MKTSFMALVAIISLTMLSGTAQAQGSEMLKPGDKLPAAQTKLKNVDGKTITLPQEMGKNGLLVMFSCNTCPFVVRNQPITKKTIAYAIAHNIGMVVVNSNEAQRDDADSYDAMKSYAHEQGYNVPYVMDDNSVVANAFGANHTPEVYLFDKTGKLVYKGAMNDNPANPGEYKVMYITNAIDALIAGREISPNATKSIGCSIKRKA